MLFGGFCPPNRLWGAQEAVVQEPPVEEKESTSEEKPADDEKSADEEKPAESSQPARRVTQRDRPAAPKATAKKQLRWLQLSGNYVDQVTLGSFDASTLLLGSDSIRTKSFYKLCDYLEEMEKEEALSHVLFDLSDPNLSLNSAQLDEFTRRLAKLKSKGKKTIAWLESAENVHLAIASQCDDILMADLAGIDMPSASMETMFYRDAMDLVGVRASIVRAGDFKGAVEPYVNPVMSEHLRDHYKNLLESLNNSRVSRIAKGRGLTTADVRELQKKRLLTHNEALAAGLVTRVAPYGSMKKTIEEMVGTDVEWTKPKSKPKRELSLFELISKSMAGPQDSSKKLRDESIVILHLQGPILDGKSTNPSAIVSGPTIKEIESLAADDKVVGVVVRINSPGGSATASEGIRQALAELAKKKPVVFSMGEVAASGGYWITCIGQPVYAEHGTITGSIGVFSLKLSFGSLMRRVGVHVESVSLDTSANLNSIDHPWTEEEIRNMQRFVDQIYDKFLAYTSESRKIPLDKLKSLAGGRVWSGDQAKSAGLIDEIGGVDDSIAAVAKRANKSNFKVVHRPEQPENFGLLRLLGEEEDENVFTSAVGREVENQLAQKLQMFGFRLDGLKPLLRYTERNDRAVPQVWALMAEELKVK